MSKTVNTLVIKEMAPEDPIIQTGRYQDYIIRAPEMVLVVAIEFHCGTYGELQAEWIMRYGAFGEDNVEAMRKVIEDFLNGRSRYPVDRRMHPRGVSRPSNGIHKIRIELDEPLKGLFEDLFNTANWEALNLIGR